MKKFLKKILSYFLVYIGVTIIFLALIIGTYMLPNTRIRGHVAESIKVLKEESEIDKPFFKTAGAILDTHTDSLILNIAMNKGMQESESDVKNAVENSFYEDSSKAGVSSLENAISDGIINNHEYSRYWHGIQVLIRPLLIFFNYSEIRYILMVIIVLLIGITFSMIGNQLGIKYSMAFAITISLMYVILIPVSIQYSSIFLVMLGAMIGVMLLYKMKKEKYMPLVFFIIGGVATFFDLLTYPLVTLGIPLTLAVLLENKRDKDKKLLEQIIFIIKLGILWAIGYSLLFFKKWIIASIILNKDAITLAMEQLVFRVNGSDAYPVNRLETIKKNFDIFFEPIARYILLIITVIWVIMFTLYKKRNKDLKIVIPLICISIVPYIWYSAFAGHSSIHSWFTNKIQAMSIFAILSAMSYTINEKNIGKYIKKIKYGGKNENNK